MWTVYGLYLPLSYPLSTWPLYGTCGAPAIRIGPVSLHSYLDSLSLCTCLSCLTQTLPRRMSLVNVRVNTTTFTWRPFLSSLFPKQAFQVGLCEKWNNLIWIWSLYNNATRCKKKSDLRRGKARNCILSCSCFLMRKGHTSGSLTLFMFVQVGQAKKKKCQLAINLPPCSCPNPPLSPLILLFFLHLFFFYDLSLFCSWTIQAESHVAQLTPTFTLSKGGQAI